MMKLIVAVAAVLVIGCCDKVLSDNAKKTEMDSVIECKAEEKATDDDMAKWRSGAEPKPRMVKCMDACVGEKMGLITNNKLNVDAVMKIYAMESNDEKAVSNMKTILNDCKDETDKDRCEASAKILKCINDGTRKYGMKEIF